MALGPIFKPILDEVKKETGRKRRSPYWVRCPACGRRVVKKELINKGCYICGWQPEIRQDYRPALVRRNILVNGHILVIRQRLSAGAVLETCLGQGSTCDKSS